MKKSHVPRILILCRAIRLFAAVFLSLLSVQSFGNGQDSCTFFSGSRTVMAKPGVAFRLRNIPAGNQLQQVGATCVVNGVTLFGSSDFVQVVAQATTLVDGIALSPTPLSRVVRLSARPDMPILLDLEATTDVLAMARFSDGAVEDVSGRSMGSTYTTSNPGIVTVDNAALTAGRVTAMGPGVAFITVQNRGATAVTQVVVSPGDPLTTIGGFVYGDDGMPINDALVTVTPGGLVDTTGPTGGNAFAGQFVISGAPTAVGSLMVTATGGPTAFVVGGGQASVAPVPGGLTDVGLFVVRPNGGFETGSFGGYLVEGNASVIPNLEFVDAPEGQFMAKISTDPNGALGRILIPNVLIPSGITQIKLLINYMTNELDQGGSFTDPFIARILSSAGGSIEYFRVDRDDMLNQIVPNLPAPTGFDGMTGFLLITGDVSSFAGTSVSLDFCFTVMDTGDEDVESAVLLDDIRLE